MIFLPPTTYHVELLRVFDLEEVEDGENVGAEELVAQVVATIASDVVEGGTCFRINDRVLDQDHCCLVVSLCVSHSEHRAVVL